MYEKIFTIINIFYKKIFFMLTIDIHIFLMLEYS